MKLTKEQVEHIARLARLGLTSQEIEKYQIELSSILDYVEKLNEIDTENVEPTAQVTGLKNVIREDRVVHVDDKENLADPKDLLACSPLPIERGQIRVKKVL